MVSKTILDDMPGAQAQRRHWPCKAPPVLPVTLRIEDRSRRHEQTPQFPRRRSRHAAERCIQRLQILQIRLAGHRQSRQCRAVGDIGCRHRFQNPGPARRLLRPFQQMRQLLKQSFLALLRIACFKRVKSIGHEKPVSVNWSYVVGCGLHAGQRHRPQSVANLRRATRSVVGTQASQRFLRR